MEPTRLFSKRADSKIPFADVPHSGTQLHFSDFHHSILVLFTHFLRIEKYGIEWILVDTYYMRCLRVYRINRNG